MPVAPAARAAHRAAVIAHARALVGRDPAAFVARTTGLVEWHCPTCTAMNRSPVDSFVGRVECLQPGCRLTWGIGLQWSSAKPANPADYPPWNATVAQVRLADDLVNGRKPGLLAGAYHNVNADAPAALGGPCAPTSPVLRAVARISGPIEWSCPQCHYVNACYADWLTGGVRCQSCGKAGRLSARLLQLGTHRRRTPLDWFGLPCHEDPVARRQHLTRQRQRRRKEARRLQAALTARDPITGSWVTVPKP